MRVGEFNKFINGLSAKCAATPCCRGANALLQLSFVKGILEQSLESRNFSDTQRAYVKGMLATIDLAKNLEGNG
jgi:hypothetical protein